MPLGWVDDQFDSVTDSLLNMALELPTLFSGATEYHSGMAIQPLYEDADIPDTLSAAVVEAVLKGASIPDTIMRASKETQATEWMKAIHWLENERGLQPTYAGIAGYGWQGDNDYNPPLYTYRDRLFPQEPVYMLKETERVSESPNLYDWATYELIKRYGFRTEKQFRDLPVLSAEKGATVRLYSIRMVLPWGTLPEYLSSGAQHGNQIARFTAGASAQRPAYEDRSEWPEDLFGPLSDWDLYNQTTESETDDTEEDEGADEQYAPPPLSEAVMLRALVYEPAPLNEVVVLNGLGYTAPPLSEAVTLSKPTYTAPPLQDTIVLGGGTSDSSGGDPVTPHALVKVDWEKDGVIHEEEIVLEIPGALTTEPEYPEYPEEFKYESWGNTVAPNEDYWNRWLFVVLKKFDIDTDDYEEKALMTYISSGQYPDVEDALFQRTTFVGHHLPMFVAGLQQTYIDDSDNRQWEFTELHEDHDRDSFARNYKQGEAFLEKIGIDWDETSQELVDGTADMGDEQGLAAIYFGIPLSSRWTAAHAYFYHLFQFWRETILEGTDGTDLSNLQWRFDDAFSDETEPDPLLRFSWALAYRQTLYGSMVSVETVNHGLQFSQLIAQTFHESFTDDLGVEVVDATWTGIKFYYATGEDKHVVIRIPGFTCLWDLGPSRRNIESLVDYHDDRFLIPIDVRALKRLSSFDRERVLLKSPHLVATATNVVEIKWYQTEIFANFVQTVQYSITIMTAITGIPGVAANFVVNLAVAALMSVVLPELVDLLVEFAVDVLGVEAAYYIAAALAIAAMYYGVSDSALFDVVGAEELMLISTNMVSSTDRVVNERIQERHKSLEQEQEDFYEAAEGKVKELEEAQELLDTQSIIDPFTFIGREPRVVIDETPDEFYNRTIHSGNIGTRVFDLVHDYVGMALELPQPRDTLNDQTYI